MKRIAAGMLVGCALWVGGAMAAIDVSRQASWGTGSASDPWRGWDWNTAWKGDTEYFFPSGHYAYSSSPDFMKPGIALRGEAGTVLQFFGKGPAVAFDNPSSWTMNLRMENFVIEGNRDATHGIFVRGARNARFSHLSVRNVTGAGFWCEACVTNVLENFRVTHFEAPGFKFAVRPDYGIVLASREGDWTTTTTITNPVIEGTGKIGIWIHRNVYGNTIINGTSEANLGRGALVEGNLNTFLNTDFEQNQGIDLEVCGNRNRFTNILSDQRVKLACGQANSFDGGNFIWIDIASNVDFTRVDGAYLNTGGINDGSRTTYKCRNQSVADGFDKRCYTGSVQDAIEPLASEGGSVATNAAKGKFFAIALFNDVVLLNPTNAVDGQTITWRFQQDGNGGGNSVTFGNLFESASGKLPAVQRGARAVTEITARYHGGLNRWLFP